MEVGIDTISYGSLVFDLNCTSLLQLYQRRLTSTEHLVKTFILKLIFRTKLRIVKQSFCS